MNFDLEEWKTAVIQAAHWCGIAMVVLIAGFGIVAACLLFCAALYQWPVFTSIIGGFIFFIIVTVCFKVWA